MGNFVLFWRCREIPFPILVKLTDCMEKRRERDQGKRRCIIPRKRVDKEETFSVSFKGKYNKILWARKVICTVKFRNTLFLRVQYTSVASRAVIFKIQIDNHQPVDHLQRRLEKNTDWQEQKPICPATLKKKHRMREKKKWLLWG